MKNIKKNSGVIRNNKKIINNNISNNNNNKLSDSIPKRSIETREKIKGLKNEIEKYKKEITDKNEIIKNQILKINNINKNFEELQKILASEQKNMKN